MIQADGGSAYGQHKYAQGKEKSASHFRTQESTSQARPPDSGSESSCWSGQNLQNVWNSNTDKETIVQSWLARFLSWLALMARPWEISRIRTAGITIFVDSEIE
jgi:hypothetical protein